LAILAPIRASDETVIAVLAIQIDSRQQFSDLAHSGRFGDSAELYAFDEQGRLLTDTRFDNELRRFGLLRRSAPRKTFLHLRDPGFQLSGAPGEIKQSETWPLTRMAEAATRQHRGHDGSGYRNFLGRRVLGSWLFNHELGIGLGIEIAEDEALSGYRTLSRLAMVAFCLVTCLGLVVAAGFVAYRRRIRRITEDTNATLEQRVVERTRELASANGRLAMEVNERRSSESRLRAVQAMLEETTEKYARLSQIDPLTELANRRRFDEFLEREWRRSIRNNSQISLLWIDVDYFKLFNDTYGHGAGDECLRSVAEVLSAAARRPGDLAARVGGEEFAIVLCDTGTEGALRVARQIHAWIEDLAIEHDTTQVIGVDNVTVSIGVASTQPELTSSPSVLVYHADEALYAAKHAGRNCIRTYESSMTDAVDYDDTQTRIKSLRSHELSTRNYR
jgi:diguanylate cyclase (GGDEF)-like protein